MLRQSSRKKGVKDICYSRLHMFLFVGFVVDGPKKNIKIQLNMRKYWFGIGSLQWTGSRENYRNPGFFPLFPVDPMMIARSIAQLIMMACVKLGLSPAA
jgi:hypothetical protein